jgi:NitT/TauT family transport system substrate-binding protein
MSLTAKIRVAFLATSIVAATFRSAAAENIIVSDYGASPGGFVYAIALAKGYFKEEGTNVTGILSSQGGGTTVRNMIAGGAIYADANPAAILAAVRQGAKLKIISDNVLLVADLVWAVKQDSPLRVPADIKGRKVGYNNPKSTTEALTLGLIKYAGLQPSDVERVKTGGFGEGVAALELGVIDVAPIPEPLWAKYQSKYRALVLGRDALPALDNTVGATTEAAAASQGEQLRGILRARRRAVQFMYANPDEAGDIVAQAYRLDAAIARQAVHNLITIDVGGTRYFGEGAFHPAAMKRMLELQVQLGAIEAPADASSIIDTQFLPDDLKQPID